MTLAESELENAWQILQKPAIILGTEPALDNALERAAQQTYEQVREMSISQLTISPEGMSDVITQTSRKFVENLFEQLAEIDMFTLVGAVLLRSKKISPDTINGLLRSMPEAWLEQAVSEASNGLIANLLKLEKLRRSGVLNDYRVNISVGRCLSVTVQDGTDGTPTFDLGQI